MSEKLSGSDKVPSRAWLESEESLIRQETTFCLSISKMNSKYTWIHLFT